VRSPRLSGRPEARALRTARTQARRSRSARGVRDAGARPRRGSGLAMYSRRTFPSARGVDPHRLAAECLEVRVQSGVRAMLALGPRGVCTSFPGTQPVHRRPQSVDKAPAVQHTSRADRVCLPPSGRSVTARVHPRTFSRGRPPAPPRAAWVGVAAAADLLHRLLALAVPNPGPHPPLLLAEFAAALARFLDAHQCAPVVGRWSAWPTRDRRRSKVVR